jgi:hypothetical protein
MDMFASNDAEKQRKNRLAHIQKNYPDDDRCTISVNTIPAKSLATTDYVWLAVLRYTVRLNDDCPHDQREEA